MQTTTKGGIREVSPILARITAAFTAVLAVAVCLVPSPLHAATATIYANDFESYSTVATSDGDTQDADPVGSEWNIADDTALLPTTAGAGVQVVNWLTNASGGATKSLLLRPSSEAQLYLAGARSGTRYQFDFNAWIGRGPTSSQSFYVILRGEGTDINGDDFLAYRTDRATNSSALYYFDAVGPGTAAFTAVGTNHLNYVWQHHRMVIDPNAQTFTLYIDDMVTPVLSNADLSRCEVPVISHIILRNEGNTADDGSVFLDDISLTVDDSRDLSTTFTDGFESYPARSLSTDDADPQGPWITTEVDGTGQGRLRAPGKVQVVGTDVVTPHSGSKCLKLEGGQRAGASLAWGVPPQSDVQVTWWAKVPEAVQINPTDDAVYLRMSLYGAEGGNTIAGDSALLGHGIRRQSNTNCVDGTSLIYFLNGWQDTTADYTPNVWEEYRLTTHNTQGRYTIVKNPSSANPILLVDRAAFVGSAANWGPTFMAAWSTSNGTNHPPVYIDDIEVKSLVSNPASLGEPYGITNYGTRFTNWSIVSVNGPVGRPAVDPRDNSTILFTTDVAGGGIYQAKKIGSGNWAIDPTPIVSGLDRPSGLAIQTNGTIWWTHDFNNDFTRSLARLKWPWTSNVPETIIADVSSSATPNLDDDAIDVAVAPFNFTGSVGQPGWIVVADRGVDGDAPNATYVVDPATTSLDQTNYNLFLNAPSGSDLGNNLNAITALPASGEVVTLSEDGYLVAINGSGALRYINALTLWPLGGPASGAALATDITTGRIWVADDLKDELWSVDASTGADVREVGFPLTDLLRPDRQIDFHDPGMAFAPNGDFLVVSDSSLSNGGGGRLIILHNEAFAMPSFPVTKAVRVGNSFQLEWQNAGAVRYRVQRGTTVNNLVDLTGDLTATQYTDTAPPAGGAFYRIVAHP